MTPVVHTAGSRQEIVATLREHVRRLEQTGTKRGDEFRRSGCTPLDRLLPERGFPAGTLIEWLGGDEASGAGTLALLAAWAAAEQGGALVVLDRRRSFYPPAAAALGVELKRIIVVRASSLDDELWACDQALRCSGVGAVWGAVDKLNLRWFRRLQLAAESGRGIGHLLRPARVRGWPSWSYAQLLVEPRPARNAPPAGCGSAGGGSLGYARRWRVELTRCHGLGRGGAVELELDDLTGAIRETIHETRCVPLASQLAHPTPHRRSARA